MKYSCTLLTANFKIFQGYVRAVWTGWWKISLESMYVASGLTRVTYYCAAD